MSDGAPVVYVGENSPEQIAYRLMLDIASVERKVLHSNSGGEFTSADRKWILDTFAQCMNVVRSSGYHL
jgi:hypothetical protein